MSDGESLVLSSLWARDPVGTTVTVNCLLNTNCGADDPVGAIDDLVFSGECTWSTDANPKNIVDCIPQSSAAWFYYERLYDGDKRREYWIYNLPSLTFTGDATAVIDPSISSLSIRSRQVSKSNFNLPVQAIWFYIIDRQCVGDPCSWNLVDYGYINLVGTTNFSNMRAEIPYSLDVDDGELQSWFVDNNWHHLVYIAYPTAEPLPGAATQCTAGTDCLVLNNSGAPNDDKRTLAMIAGVDLSAIASPRPNGNLADYFENENSSPVDGIFEKGQITVNFNDQIRVISTSP